MLRLLKNNLTNDLTVRLGNILVTASMEKDMGVVEWVERAYLDAQHLGRLRDRDTRTLERLERTYNDRYYTEHRGSVFA